MKILTDYDRVLKIEEMWIEGEYAVTIQEYPGNGCLQQFLTKSNIFLDEQETMKFFMNLI